MATIRRITMGRTVLAIAALLCAPAIFAATCAVPSVTYATIQSAINDTTTPCTEIDVAAGTYNEHLLITHGPLTFNGDPSSPTVINAGAISSVVNVILSSQTLTFNHLTFTGGNSSSGGGLNLTGTVTVNLNYCTVSGNTAADSPGHGPGNGGGISLNNSTANLFNSTVANNTAASGFNEEDNVLRPGSGGGILLFNSSTLTAVSSTVADNVAEDGDTPAAGAGIWMQGNSPSSTALTNTLVAGNTHGISLSNCAGKTPTDGGYNMSDDATCGFSATGSANSVANLNLDTLKDNGGPTQTIALLSGSDAIDQIALSTNGCGTTVATDQRGVPRPQNGSCDIGAFEVCNTPPTVTCPADSSASADANCQAQIPDVLPGVTTSDNCVPGDTPALQQSPTAGTLVGLGPHTITVTATDGSGNTNTCTTTFTVNDTTPPVVSSSVSVGILVNDHTMRNVGYSESATDNCGGDLTNSAVIEIYSSEPEQAPTGSGGDGTTSPDARGRGTCYDSGIWINKIALRQERLNNGPGRIYLIKTSATDSSDNTGWSCATVVSPRSNKKTDLNKVLAAASAVNTVCNQFGAIPSNYYLIGCGPVIGSKQ